MSAPPKELEALRGAILDQETAIDQSLSKAAGILFVMSQVREAEVVSDELTGYAIWAARDFIHDAQRANRERENLERQYWAATEPEAARG